MNVASKALCEELYKLSGWKTGEVIRDNPTQSAYNQSNIIAYRYDLGYLLRKLHHDNWQTDLMVMPTMSSIFISLGMTVIGGYIEPVEKIETQYADTPEDAVCKLAIELFKQNILTRENTHAR